MVASIEVRMFVREDIAVRAEFDNRSTSLPIDLYIGDEVKMHLTLDRADALFLELQEALAAAYQAAK